MNEKPKLHVVSFSGGKDSTAMLLRMIEENMPIDIILYCDTGLEFPEMNDHIDKVEKYIGRKITRLKAEKDFMYWATEHEFTNKSGDTVIGKGYPTRKIRWCNQKLKRDVINKYLAKYRKTHKIINYVGIAYDEPERVDEFVYPLVTWRMTENECLKYCYKHGFDWNGLYEIWDRVSCWCCPLQSLDSLRKLRKHRPELWSKLIEMDVKLQQTNLPNFKFDVALRDLLCRFDIEDEFVAQGKKLRTKEFFQALKDRGINY